MTPSGPKTTSPASRKPATEDALPARRPNALRRLYNWVLSWADTPYGTPALAGLSFAESSFFPIPPDVLQIALSMAKPRWSYWYAFVSAVASVLGGLGGYVVGHVFWNSLSGFFFRFVPGVTPENVAFVGQRYEENAFYAIFLAAFSPIPFKVFTISAGVFSQYVPISTLLFASAIGRSLRFGAVATAIYFFGPVIRPYLERYFEWITLVLGILLVLGFAALKYAF